MADREGPLGGPPASPPIRDGPRGGSGARRRRLGASRSAPDAGRGHARAMSADIGVRVPPRRLVPVPRNTSHPLAGRGPAKARGAVTGSRVGPGVTRQFLKRLVMDPEPAMAIYVASITGVVGGRLGRPYGQVAATRQLEGPAAATPAGEARS